MRSSGSPGQQVPPTRAQLARGTRSVTFRKLSPLQRIRIRRRYGRGGVTLKMLAEEYGVSEYTIWRAVHTKEARVLE